MLLVVITIILVAVGVLAYCYGAWKLSRYAARVSGGLAIGVLLFPPIAFWFAFYKLEQEGKELPITMWLFGMVSSILLTFVFWTPISYTLTGRFAELEGVSSISEEAVAAHGIKAEDLIPSPEEPTPPPTEAPAATNNAPAATNGATNGTNAATNGAPASTNNAATNGGAATAAGTAGAAQ